jgi:superkiller protein 3
MLSSKDIEQAISCFQSGYYDIADSMAEGILGANPKVVEALLIRAVVAGIRGLHKDAEGHLMSAIRIDRSNHYLYYNLAKSISAQGRDKEALKWHKKALQLNQSNAEAFLNFGHSLMSLGSIDQALNAFDKAILLNGNMAEAYSNKAGRCPD